MPKLLAKDFSFPFLGQLLSEVARRVGENDRDSVVRQQRYVTLHLDKLNIYSVLEYFVHELWVKVYLPNNTCAFDSLVRAFGFPVSAFLGVIPPTKSFREHSCTTQTRKSHALIKTLGYASKRQAAGSRPVSSSAT